MEMERTLGTAKFSIEEDRNLPIYFTKEPVESLFEAVYRAALELGLEAEVDKKKYKITLKTVSKEEEPKEVSEEEQILMIQDPSHVEMYFKFAKVEGDDELVAAEAVKVNGTRLSMR